MIVKIVFLDIFWLNTLPPSPSVGGNLIPHQIVTSLTIDYAKHCRLQFGEYAQVHVSHNNTRGRTDKTRFKKKAEIFFPPGTV